MSGIITNQQVRVIFRWNFGTGSQIIIYEPSSCGFATRTLLYRVLDMLIHHSVGCKLWVANPQQL